MQKVVFIASLHRSGSTVLELILSSLPSVVGLGELHGAMCKPEIIGKAKCGCGIPAANCQFWKKTAVFSGNAEDRYAHLIRIFSQHFGPDHILVDSSKKTDALKAWQSIPGVDVRVIYLVRDVRAWTTSRLSKHDKKSYSPLRYFIQWHLGNVRMKKHLIESGANFLQIGYEELVLSRNPAAPLKRIAEFLDTECTKPTMSLKDAKSHSIGGNRMLHDPQKRNSVYYDNRWFYNSKWLLASVLTPWIMRFNARHVYGDTTTPPAA